LGIPHRVASLELNVDTLASLQDEYVNYEPIPAYPSVERDVSFLIASSTLHADIVTRVLDVDAHIRSITLLDVYTGEHVPEGKKSMAYRITYRSDEKTLETKDVAAMHEQVIDALVTQFQIEVR
jgi:phenylalanyl-tRNA synthetase beta chain